MMTNLLTGLHVARQRARPWQRALECAAALLVGASALTLALPADARPRMPDLPIGVAPYSVALSVVLVLLAWLAYRDQRTRQVPNWAVYALMLAALARAAMLREPVFLLFWGALWLAWSARVFGGGDAKLLMGLFGLFPNAQMLATFVGGVLVTGIPQVLWKYRGQWLSATRRAGWRIMSRQILPGVEELETQGRAGTWRYALIGAAYLMLFWRG
jgi:Flp pilus assembly protein protease CpaA